MAIHNLLVAHNALIAIIIDEIDVKSRGPFQTIMNADFTGYHTEMHPP